MPLPTGRFSWGTPFGTPGSIWSSGHHTGQDFGAASGVPILAAAEGTVTIGGQGGAYGNHVIVRHPDGLTTLYAHMSQVDTANGARVTAGQRIGYVGSTGNTTGPHLHFEVRKNNVPVDPKPWLTGAATVADYSAGDLGVFDPAAADAARAELDAAQAAYELAEHQAVESAKKRDGIVKQIDAAKDGQTDAQNKINDFARSAYMSGSNPELADVMSSLDVHDAISVAAAREYLSHASDVRARELQTAVDDLARVAALHQAADAEARLTEERRAAAKKRMDDAQTAIEAAPQNYGTATPIDPSMVPVVGPEMGRKAAAFGLTQVGHPYTPAGGTGPQYGCNGFAWRALHEGGSRWPLQMAYDQAMNRDWVTPVPRGSEQPGDLLFFQNNNGTDSRGIDHVAVIVNPDTGLFVHAANSRVGVVTNNYKTTGYYAHPIMVGRVIR